MLRLVTDVPPLAFAGIPLSPNIVLQTLGQNMIMISDLPGPTGGIMLKSTTGATLIVNDIGIFIQNGKGASIVMTTASSTQGLVRTTGSTSAPMIRRPSPRRSRRAFR